MINICSQVNQLTQRLKLSLYASHLQEKAHQPFIARTRKSQSLPFFIPASSKPKDLVMLIYQQRSTSFDNTACKHWICLLIYWEFPIMLIQHPANSDWLLSTQSRVLQADWLILENNERATLNINMPFWCPHLTEALPSNDLKPVMNICCKNLFLLYSLLWLRFKAVNAKSKPLLVAEQ